MFHECEVKSVFVYSCNLEVEKVRIGRIRMWDSIVACLYTRQPKPAESLILNAINAFPPFFSFNVDKKKKKFL